VPEEKSQGIKRDQRGEEQPTDKDRAQTAQKTDHAPKKEQGRK
jgi:hypothetical protein